MLHYEHLFYVLLISSICHSQVLEIKGNNTVITNGDITPSLTDFTDFESVKSVRI